MTKAVEKVVKALKQKIEPEYKKTQKTFFKEPVLFYGVRSGEVRKIANQAYREIEPKDKAHIFKLCEELLADEKQETLLVASVWAEKTKKEWTSADFKTFEKWVKKYVTNWASCDTMCPTLISPLLQMYPKLIPSIRPWRKSTNRWLRRAAAVGLIRQAQAGERLPEIFAMAKELLEDDDDLVQKAYGWMLKEASNTEEEKVFEFVMKHKAKMPRTALRYAIEKMPKKLKVKAMAT